MFQKNKGPSIPSAGPVRLMVNGKSYFQKLPLLKDLGPLARMVKRLQELQKKKDLGATGEMFDLMKVIIDKALCDVPQEERDAIDKAEAVRLGVEEIPKLFR